MSSSCGQKEQLNMSTSNEDNFISGISLHCDRWCERCQFTDRCRLFAMEQERGIVAGELTGEALARELKSIFAEAKQMILEGAAKWGIDPTPMSDEEFAEIRRRQREFVDGDELAQMGDSYWPPAKEILEDESLANVFANDESLIECLEVLWQFVFFIPVNIKSSLNALLDEDGFEDKEEETDPESYANGSAKSALVAIDRSILAWSGILNAVGTDRVQPLIDLLASIRTKMEERFPLARDFIRPGFDEVGAVM